MVLATRYTVERGTEANAYRIRNQEAPVCPLCGLLLSGYDTRARHVIDGAGVVYWFRLRRLRCPGCGRLHLELPAFMQARKHYDAAVISDVAMGKSDDCPADASTMRRWRRENRPPSLPSFSHSSSVQCGCADKKEECP